MDRIRQLPESDRKAYEEVFKAALHSPYALLSSMDAYVLNKPGKQIRPALALAAAGVCGTLVPLTYAVAAIAEMIHTASLLHDDVADNAQTRRGENSVQKQFGPRAAIVLGDFWLARALQLLVKHDGEHLMYVYADTVAELSQGELMQMEKTCKKDITLSEYYAICKKKTASLFRASVLTGARSVPEKERAARFIPLLDKAAYHMGMAFQINDDIADLESDLSDAKITLPLLGALMQEKEENRLMEARTNIAALGKDTPEAVASLLAFIEVNKGKEYAQKIADHHTEQARKHIRSLPDSVWRECLMTISGM